METWSQDGDGDRKLDEILAEITRERMGFGINARAWAGHLREEAIGQLSGPYKVDRQKAERMVEKASAGGDDVLAEMVAWMRLLSRQGRTEVVAASLNERTA